MTAKPNPDLALARGLWWLAQGAALVPKRSREKATVAGFGPRRRRITTRAELEEWVGKGVNLAVVAAGTGDVVCADFESLAAYEAWRDHHGRSITTLTEQTGRGMHVFFRALGADLVSAAGESVEFIAHPTSVTIAPSLHVTGREYRLHVDAPLAALTAAEQLLRFPFVAAAVEARDRQRALRVRSGKGPRQMFDGPDLVSRIKRGASLVEEAERLQLQLLGGGGHYVCRCPFHDDHGPSMWLDECAGLWGCYSTRCIVAQRARAHDVINLRAWGGRITVREAIAELARELGLASDKGGRA